MKSNLYAVLIPVVVLLSTFVPAVGAVVGWMALFSGFMWATFHFVYKVNSQFWDKLAQVGGASKAFLPDMKALGGGSTRGVVVTSIIMIVTGVVLLINPIKLTIAWVYNVEPSIIPRLDILVFLLAIYSSNCRFSRDTSD